MLWNVFDGRDLAEMVKVVARTEEMNGITVSEYILRQVIQHVVSILCGTVEKEEEDSKVLWRHRRRSHFNRFSRTTHIELS